MTDPAGAGNGWYEKPAPQNFCGAGFVDLNK
jgi:hypothetical protein